MLNVKFIGASALVLNVKFVRASALVLDVKNKSQIAFDGRRFASWLRAVPFVTSYATGRSLIETVCAVAAKTFAELVSRRCCESSISIRDGTCCVRSVVTRHV